MCSVLKILCLFALIINTQINMSCGTDKITSGIDEHEEMPTTKPTLQSIRHFMQEFYASKNEDVYNAFTPSSSKYYIDTMATLPNSPDELFFLALDIGGIYRYLGNYYDAAEVVYFAFKNNWHINQDDLVKRIELKGYDSHNLTKDDIKNIYNFN